MELHAKYQVATEADIPICAYVLLLHLVHERYVDFDEMQKVIHREAPESYYITLLDYIVQKIRQLEAEWGEKIPPITALVFNQDGSASTWACAQITGDADVSPNLHQIVQLTNAVDTYDKWEAVLQAFKP